MRWFSRLHRPTTLPTVSVTVAYIVDSHVKYHSESSGQPLFSALDESGIPATWATGVVQAPEIARMAISSTLLHELALLNIPAALSQNIPQFRTLQALAHAADLPLRTLVTPKGGIHPSLLEQLGITAVVSSGPQKFSRTGQFRAFAWNTWEAPATDRVTLPCSPDRFTKLCNRVRQILKQSTRLHLLLEMPHAVNQHDLNPLADWLEIVADYLKRGWLKVETVGQRAVELNQSIADQASPASRAA